MLLQRKLTLMVTTGAVALGAGHFVQQQAADRAGSDAKTVVVSSVMTVAAGPEEIEPRVPQVQQPVLPAEAATDAVVEQETAAETLVAAATISDSAPIIPTKDAFNDDGGSDCPINLDLVAQSGAMIGVSLLAPCHADQRVVLRHEGLAVTGRTSSSGALFLSLPAFTAVAEVQAAFAMGDKVTETLTMTDFDGIERFAVQWQDADAFQLHAFENGAGYDQPGHISAAFTGKPGMTGVMTVLGDTSTDLPLLSEIYTFGPETTADVVLEAAVTETACGRELLGETIHAKNGRVVVTEVTVAMPDCDAVGDILVLKNLLQDMTLAAAQ
ncbi:MAG: hypothetical protein ACK4RZ_07690 [Paracoccaceae bacterium]